MKKTERRETEKKAKRAAKSAARKAIVNPYKKGDILYNSWGYDQTNVDWYVVVRVSPKSVFLRSIPGIYKETSSEGLADMSGSSTPNMAWFNGAGATGKTIRKTLQVLDNGEVYIPMQYGWVCKWDGKKDVYESHYA